ncbi:alpha/beta hydrolase [Amycolatopsis alkalitolerans]|uniref:Alpha/beta hydrolase n=1 Tax=Amycolatopsis alkalitolerans TaxID=2547244 RepID=A0A5C4M9P0_9PSEU|nr:hypothetical protein [Amycolatopsis alkalitolerans]TNC29644.1 hypothetical protein FG385_01395 [Amycolatopsis alkalitolerans]
MDVTLIEAESPRGIVLFGPGAGGAPDRYRHVLEAAAADGYTVAAPIHERFDGRTVTDDQMLERADGLQTALAAVDRPDLPVVAAGHSAGAWAALCLAGALPCGRDRQPLEVPAEPRVSRLVLLAPTVGWFQGSGALDRVTVPTTVFVGSSDVVTPPSSAELLRAVRGSVEIRSYDGVGHLDFMCDLPPGVQPTAGLDHNAFLDRLAADFVRALS